MLFALIHQENKDFRTLLKSQIIRTDKKNQILESVFKDKVNELTMSFISLLIKKRREFFINNIAISFNEKYKEHIGIKTAFIETPIEITEEIREKVIRILEKETNSKIELIEKINTKLIGGFSLRVGDKHFDASLYRKIQQLNREFGKNIYLKGF